MKNNDKKKIIISIIAVLLIVVLIAGGTFAWWTWTSSNNTAISFTVEGGSMTIDGGGNITGQKMVPTDECSGTYAIVRTVKVSATNQTSTSMTATVQLDLSGLPSALRTSNLKYTFSETQGCTTGSPTGTLSGTTTPFTLTSFSVAAGATVNKTYYLYIWLDSAETSSATQGKSFTIKFAGTLVQNAS